MLVARTPKTLLAESSTTVIAVGTPELELNLNSPAGPCRPQSLLGEYFTPSHLSIALLPPFGAQRPSIHAPLPWTYTLPASVADPPIG